MHDRERFAQRAAPDSQRDRGNQRPRPRHDPRRLGGREARHVGKQEMRPDEAAQTGGARLGHLYATAIERHGTRGDLRGAACADDRDTMLRDRTHPRGAATQPAAVDRRHILGRERERADRFAPGERREVVVVRKREQRRRMERERHARRRRLARQRFNRERRGDEIRVRIDQPDTRRAHDGVRGRGIVCELAPERLRFLAPRPLNVGELKVHSM